MIVMELILFIVLAVICEIFGFVLGVAWEQEKGGKHE